MNDLLMEAERDTTGHGEPVETSAAPRTEPVRYEAPPVPIAPADPMEMVARAMELGQSPETIQAMMDFQDRWEAKNARRAFDAAVSAAKAEIPVIAANASGHNNKRYADFAAIARVVDPILGQHGLSYRFRTTQDERIHVTCVLSHCDGHSEETTLAGPADTTGSKNAIQAIGSTLTYLQRYSLTQALGLAAAKDDDGQSAGGQVSITAKNLKTLQERIMAVGADLPKLLAYLKVESLEDLPDARFEPVLALVNRKADQAKDGGK